jgi:hypothetical protein
MFMAKAALRMTTRRRFMSLVVMAVSLVLILFINMYARTIDQHQATLAELHANIKVTGYITSADGARLDDLAINDFVIGQLEASGYISQGLYTRNLRCMLEPWPQLGYMHIYTMLLGIPKLVGATDNTAISFFAHEGQQPQYLDGYDHNLFSLTEKVCIVSESFLRENSLELGDKIQLTVAENPDKVKDSYCYGTVTLQIVGTYQSNQIYNAPLYCPWDIMTEIYHEIGLPLTWNSARFTLYNTQRLNDFKGLLNRLGFVSRSQASEMEEKAEDRLSFLIDDSILNEATASVKGYIELSRVLYPIIYLLCAGIGFIVSYLLVRLRKPEFAIMCSLGASRIMGFLIFFMEQGLLTVLGIGLGIVLTLIITGGGATIQIATIAGYLACYLAGTAMAIFTLNRVNVIQILTAKE